MKGMATLIVIAVLLQGCSDGNVQAQSSEFRDNYVVLGNSLAVRDEFNAYADQLKLLFIVGPS